MLEKRAWLLFALLAVLAALPLSINAQQSDGDAPAATEAPVDEGTQARRLPNLFGRLAVSDEQREELLAIQEDYEVRIEELRNQIRALVRERDAAMEAKLTRGQKLRLEELREEARARAAEAGPAEGANPPAEASGPEISDGEANR